MPNSDALSFEIRLVEGSDDDRRQLAALLIETVAAGGSVSFMHPLSGQAADRFWDSSLASVGRGERAILGAWAGDKLAGTVTVLLDFPENQRHRAEIAKLMTGLEFRGRGVARALIGAAETLAVERGKSHLLLDTAAEDGAAGLYQKLGFRLIGEIPNFAQKPYGGLTGTLIFWKELHSAPRKGR
ncbi:MAG: GNAT family N-acetyltransferase [Rhizobiaceae bacterium]|nr:GNAT family N-acetyltransferase [Rhizobiaceae bacterium]